MSGPHGPDSASSHTFQPQASSTLLRRILLGRSINRGPPNTVSRSVALDPVRAISEASLSANVEAQGHIQPSLLQHAQNLGISGGSFISTGGDFVNPNVTYSGNITIHNHNGRTQGHVEDDSQLETSQVPVANQTPNSDMEVHSEIPEDNSLPSLRVAKSCDVYRRLLIVKGRGFPLWIPGPNENLPIEYRRAGIAIGDIGILKESGSFDFLFNICLPKNHPINRAGVPDEFYPLDDIPLDDISRHCEFDVGSHIASTFVETVRHNDTLSNALSFESSAKEGAILTMPHGAVTQDLSSEIDFQEYMAQHIENWYKYIIGVRGRKIGNGGVRLVIGVDTAPTWGMAAFSKSTQCSPLRLKFKPTTVSSTDQHYGWEYSGGADAKSGPSTFERERLHSDDNADTGSRYINQSLFVRTMTATLEKTIWDKLMTNINAARINARASRKSANVYSQLGTSEDTSSGTSNENTTTWRSANPCNLTGDPFLTSTSSQPDPSLYIIGDTTETIDHPSNKINDLLMKKVQTMFPDETPRMVITKDQDWISVLDKNDLVLPTSEELYERIEDAETFAIMITNNGVLLLESVQHEDTFEPLSTEILNPNSNLSNQLQRVGPHPPDLSETLSGAIDSIFISSPTEPESMLDGSRNLNASQAAAAALINDVKDRRNTAQQLFDSFRDDPKDLLIMEVMGSDNESDYKTNFGPPSPPPPNQVLMDLNTELIASRTLSTYSSSSQHSDLSFSLLDPTSVMTPSESFDFSPNMRSTRAPFDISHSLDKHPSLSSGISDVALSRRSRHPGFYVTTGESIIFGGGGERNQTHQPCNDAPGASRTSVLHSQIPPTTKHTAYTGYRRGKQEGKQDAKLGFVCHIPGCRATFTHNFSLTKHLRSHIEEKPYKCHRCGKGYPRLYDCKRHAMLCARSVESRNGTQKGVTDGGIETGYIEDDADGMVMSRKGSVVEVGTGSKGEGQSGGSGGREKPWSGVAL